MYYKVDSEDSINEGEDNIEEGEGEVEGSEPIRVNLQFCEGCAAMVLCRRLQKLPVQVNEEFWPGQHEQKEFEYKAPSANLDEDELAEDMWQSDEGSEAEPCEESEEEEQLSSDSGDGASDEDG